MINLKSIAVVSGLILGSVTFTSCDDAEKKEAKETTEVVVAVEETVVVEEVAVVDSLGAVVDTVVVVTEEVVEVTEEVAK